MPTAAGEMLNLGINDIEIYLNTGKDLLISLDVQVSLILLDERTVFRSIVSAKETCQHLQMQCKRPIPRGARRTWVATEPLPQLRRPA